MLIYNNFIHTGFFIINNLWNLRIVQLLHVYYVLFVLKKEDQWNVYYAELSAFKFLPAHSICFSHVLNCNAKLIFLYNNFIYLVPYNSYMCYISWVIKQTSCLNDCPNSINLFKSKVLCITIIIQYKLLKYYNVDVSIIALYLSSLEQLFFLI